MARNERGRDSERRRLDWATSNPFGGYRDASWPFRGPTPHKDRWSGHEDVPFPPAGVGILTGGWHYYIIGVRFLTGIGTEPKEAAFVPAKSDRFPDDVGTIGYILSLPWPRKPIPLNHSAEIAFPYLDATGPDVRREAEGRRNAQYGS